MTISVLQERQASNGSGAAANIQLAFSNPVTPGSSIHVICSAIDTATSFTCSDSVNGSYGAALDTIDQNGDTQRLAHFKFDNTGAGTPTVTITPNTSVGFLAIWIREIGGTSGYDAAHKAALQTALGNGTDNITTGTQAPNNQPGLLSALGVCTSNFVLPAAGTGFTAGANGWTFGTSNTACTESKRYTATTAIAATFSNSGGSNNFASLAAFFKEAASGAALAGTPASASTATGALSTGIKLAGTPTSVSTAVGFLMGLMGNAIVASVATGALSTGIKLAGAMTSPSTAVGTLGAAIQLAAAALSASSAGAALTNWTTVTLGSSLVTGTNSVLNSHLWPAGAPGPGAVLSYDATNVTINTDGTFTATSNNFSFVVEFQDVTSPSHYRTAVVTVTPGMVGYADLTTAATGSLSTAIQLAGAATLLVNATGSLNAQINLVAAAQAVSAAVGALTTQIILAAGALSTTAAQGTLSGTISSLAGNAVSTTSATGFLNAQIQLAASAVSLATAVGNLATQIRLAGAALTVSSGSGTIGTGTPLQGVANAQSVASGALITAIRVNGAAIAASVAVAALTTQIALLGAAVSASSASGTLTAATRIDGAAVSTSTAAGQLSTLISMNVSAFSISSASAALITGIPLEGGAIVQDAATGDLRATGSPVSAYSVDPFFVIGQRRQYFTQRFPVIGPGEEHILTFNFADELAPGETLQGIVNMNVIASAGVDGNAPGSLLDGIAAYDPALKQVLQPIHGAIQDNDYYFTVTAHTSNPFKTLTRFGLLSVRG